jgi:peroxiredoxin
MKFIKNLNRNFIKTVIGLCFSLYGFLLFAQEEVKKPEYIIIANNEIITKEELGELGKEGFIKGMNKGVTEDRRNRLAEVFGDKIGDREFIIEIDLFTEKEKLERENKKTIDEKKPIVIKKRTDELKLNINDTALDFTVEMINGENIKLSNLRGKIVLVNYWATWCAPCLMEFAEFPEKILKPFKDENFILIAISIGESKEKVEQKMDKLKKYGVDFNVGIDPPKEIWNQYAKGAIPKSFLIDQNGIIKYISIGNSEGNVEILASEIEKLLE